MRDGKVLALTGPDVMLRYELMPPTPIAELVGTTWVLESLVTGDTVTSAQGTPTLRLDANQTYTGSTGCRSFSGEWAERGGRLEFPSGGIDQLGCRAPLRAQDSLVFQTLGNGFLAEFTVDGQKLTVTVPDGSGLVYRAQE